MFYAAHSSGDETVPGGHRGCFVVSGCNLRTTLENFCRGYSYAKNVLSPATATSEEVPPAQGRNFVNCPWQRLKSVPSRRKQLSDGLVFDDGLLAAIVATFAAYGVVDVPSTAVGAKCKGGGYCFVVCATFSGAGLRLLAFRMCHCFGYCMVTLFYLFVVA